VTKLGPSVQPRQGERIVVLSDGAELLDEDDLVMELRPILESRNQAEGAATAAATSRGNEARGIILTPYQDIDKATMERRLPGRVGARQAAVGALPSVDWLWCVTQPVQKPKIYR
jgi:hypothetical protein